MNKFEYEELQDVLRRLTEALKDEGLSEEQRHELKMHQAFVSGQITSMWLPISNPRKAIMFAFILLGLRAFTNYNDMYIVYWLLAAIFSPRIVATAAYYFGRLMGGFK